MSLSRRGQPDKQPVAEDPVSPVSGHVAEFTIDGQAYLVIPNRIKSAISAKQRKSEIKGYSIDGELRIGNNNYIITLAEKHKGASGETERRMRNLTKREWDIVTYVAEGCVNKQIADRLHISEWTVSTHMRRIFAKLGVDSRAAMVYRCSSFVGRQI